MMNDVDVVLPDGAPALNLAGWRALLDLLVDASRRPDNSVIADVVPLRRGSDH
jgi:hypothetical protein